MECRMCPIFHASVFYLLGDMLITVGSSSRNIFTSCEVQTGWAMSEFKTRDCSPDVLL